MEDFLYQLIRVAVGTQDALSQSLSKDEWESLFVIAKKQSLVGVLFYAIQKLGANSDGGYTDIGIPEKLYFTWMSQSLNIQTRNQKMQSQCHEISKSFIDKDVQCSILKGQALAQYYGILSCLRQSSDIDIYVDCGRDMAIQIATEINKKEERIDFKHANICIFSDVNIEMHYVPEVTLDVFRMPSLMKFWHQFEADFFTQEGKFTTVSPRMNAFYLLLHSYTHLIYGGVGMRLIMDYYFFLQTHTLSIEEKNFVNDAIKRFGLGKFAKSVMWILSSIFYLSQEKLLCEPDENEGRFLLGEIIQGGNFGKYDKRLSAVRGAGKIAVFNRLILHNISLLQHYPREFFCAPIYFIWHFIWKKWYYLVKK